MTALDAAFFHLERTGQLLHVAGIYTVEGALDFERLKADLASRLHQIPRYTERVVPVPLNVAHPTWEPDPAFSIRHHVLRHTLKPPGDDEQLARLASRLFAQPLNRSRPLWELHQIDGYHGDRTALFTKVHHCMIDGVSGVHLLGVLFDATPNPPALAPPPSAPVAPPLPSAATQLLRGVRETIELGRARAHALGALLRRPAKALEELGRAADAVSNLASIVLGGTPDTPFNGHVSTLRRVVWTTVSLNEVKAIKDRLGGTVNDVVLATIATALRGYLEDRGVLPDRVELRAMIPVNIRLPHEVGALGNRVSMMVAPLPVGIYDPLERLRQVRSAMAQLKRGGQAERMSRMLALFEILPPMLQKPLGWLQVQAAPVNTICTNVPGPPVSLYAQGRRLETLVPIVPLAQGVGLAFAMLSYTDSLTFGVSSDPALVPDGERICERLQAAHAELRELAGVEPAEGRPGVVRPERHRRIAAPSRVA